jgi:hypothetical protein
MTAIPAGTAVRTGPPPKITVAALGVLSLALWPVEIHRAFGLPAHPLLIHVPVIFIPVLALAVLATVLLPKRMEPYGLALAAFAVLTNAATLLAVGAGEAFRADRERGGGPGGGGAENSTLNAHADAAETLRWIVIALTALLIIALFVSLQRMVYGLAAIAAVAAIFFCIRTGHLGAKLAWGGPQGGGGGQGFPGGGQFARPGGQGAGGGSAPGGAGGSQGSGG